MTHTDERTERIGVTAVFPLQQQGRLMVHLESFELNFKPLGQVDLCFADQRLPMRCIASGNVTPVRYAGGPWPPEKAGGSRPACTAVVALVPTDATGMSITAIADAFARRDPKKEAFLERAREH
jgi:hypothetical protein